MSSLLCEVLDSAGLLNLYRISHHKTWRELIPSDKEKDMWAQISTRTWYKTKWYLNCLVQETVPQLLFFQINTEMAAVFIYYVHAFYCFSCWRAHLTLNNLFVALVHPECNTGLVLFFVEWICVLLLCQYSAQTNLFGFLMGWTCWTFPIVSVLVVEGSSWSNIQYNLRLWDFFVTSPLLCAMSPCYHSNLCHVGL